LEGKLGKEVSCRECGREVWREEGEEDRWVGEEGIIGGDTVGCLFTILEKLNAEET